MKWLCSLLLASAALVDPAATMVDGPYVVPGANRSLESWTVESDPGGIRKTVRRTSVGARISVAPVGDLPGFEVTLRAGAPVARAALTIAPAAPVFVVADTHGEFELLAKMLRAHRVIGPRLQWSFGKGQLVVLGDVFDRGPHHTEILWLLYELEQQARTAGGAVHLVLGNHETMVMRGDLRYLNPKYPASAQTLAVDSYARLFAPDTVLGQWLRSRPALLRLNRALFVHGGISPDVVARKLTLADINASIRGVLAGSTGGDVVSLERAELLMGPLGPLWYRGYFAGHEDFPTASTADVTRMLAAFQADRIFVGHTTVPTITRLHEGRVIAVQVYPKREPDGVQFEALLIRGGKLLRARFDGGTEPI